MGQKPSVSRLPSRDELLQKKSEGRVVINMIFSWLKDQTSFDDLLLLGNPHKCTDYIFLTADALQQVFDVLRVYPEKDQKGVIYFKKIEDLKSSQMDYRPLCLQIAFFYIRIFQVFGALSMSVLDVDPVYTTAVQGHAAARAAVVAAPWVGYRAAGGAIRESELRDPLTVLAPYLDYSERDDYYILSGTEIYVRKKMQILTSAGLFQILHVKRDLKETTANIRITRFEPTRIKLSVTESKPRKISLKDLTLKMTDPFSNIYKSDTGHDIKYYLKKIIEEIEKEAIAEKRQELAIEARFVQSGLQAKHISESLSRPPKAHCVARALQLLSTDGLAGSKSTPSTVYTRMCDPIYFSENFSLPKADSKISDEIGLFVLNQMFYDTLAQTGAKMSGVAEEKHKAFLRELKVLFEDLPLEQRATLRVESIADVKNKIPKSCKAGQPVMKTTHAATIRDVRKLAAQMLWFQIEHTAQVTKLLGKLFKLPLKQGDKVSLHPSIYKTGILGVNQVAEEARALLIQYYKKCETLYRAGTALYESQGRMEAI